MKLSEATQRWMREHEKQLKLADEKKIFEVVYEDLGMVVKLSEGSFRILKEVLEKTKRSTQLKVVFNALWNEKYQNTDGRMRQELSNLIILITIDTTEGVFGRFREIVLMSDTTGYPDSYWN